MPARWLKLGTVAGLGVVAGFAIAQGRDAADRERYDRLLSAAEFAQTGVAHGNVSSPNGGRSAPVPD